MKGHKLLKSGKKNMLKVQVNKTAGVGACRQRAAANHCVAASVALVSSKQKIFTLVGV